VLRALASEADSWDSDYTALSRRHPEWESEARAWQDRLGATRELLARMGRILDSPLELEYGGAEHD
jgi:hypothetical protein